MGQTKKGSESIDNAVYVFGSGVTEAGPRGTGSRGDVLGKLSGEILWSSVCVTNQSLPHGQGREMNVVFWRITNITTIVFRHIFWGDAVIGQLALDGMKACTLIGQNLQES